jgi:two-component system cell cycle response regulator
VTVSVGLAERTEGWSTPEQVITAADKALYQAKRAGRNRVVAA